VIHSRNIRRHRGEKVLSQQDFDSPKLYGLPMTRTYRGSNFEWSIFGQKWRSPYDFGSLRKSGCASNPDYSGQCMPTSITAMFPDGSDYRFNATGNVAGESFAVAGSTMTLRWTGATTGTPYILSTPAGTYHYSYAGYLQRVTDEYGTSNLISITPEPS